MGKTIFKLSEEDKQKICKLADEGKTDTEIAKLFNVTDGTIFYWRKKLNIKSKFTYDKISKINKTKFLELFNQNLSDYAIAKQLNMSPDGIYSHRIRYGYVRKKDLRYNEKIKLSKFQKQVLLGTLLGDSTCRCTNKNPRISCAHCIKQKEYCEYKTLIFKNLGATCNYHKRHLQDKRNSNIYEDYTMYIPSNPAFLSFYREFYKKHKKVIPFKLFHLFTEVSLAFMYMDDGTKTKSGYSIATNCFTQLELLKFANFLYNKWGIETSILKSNILYIKAKSASLFKFLIQPYIHESMKYKL